MPKPKKQTKQEARRAAPPWLVAAAVAAVLLGVGLYGVRAGWFESEEEEAEFVPPKLSQPPPQRGVDTHDDDVARAAWGAPEGVPVVAVGSAGGPATATLAVRDGRADVAIRVPSARGDGTPYVAYSLDVRSGDRRLWGNRLAIAEAKEKPEAIGLSFNAQLLHEIGADQGPITVVVGGNAPRKGDALGVVQLTVQQTP